MKALLILQNSFAIVVNIFLDLAGSIENHKFKNGIP